MKKNIFFVVFFMLILLSAGLYFITEYIYKDRVNANINSLKETSLSVIEMISPEIKASFLKADDIALLYNIEKISKLNNISDAFIINNDMEILIHNDSTKWNKKFDEQIYQKAVETKNKLIQNISDYKFLYSLPINESSTLCVNISLDKIINDYNSFRIKLYIIFGILVILILFLLSKMLKFFFLRPFNKAKQYLAMNETKKKTIYWELIDMARKDMITESSQITDEQLDKENIKELFNFASENIFKQENDVLAILDTSTKLLYCKDKEKNIFEEQKLNTHIVNATTNVEIIKNVSEIVEKAAKAQEIELSMLNLNIKIIPVNNRKNIFIGIIIKGNFVGI